MPATIEEKIETALFDFARALGPELEGAPPLAFPNVSFPADGGAPPAVYIEIRHFRNDNHRLYSKGSNPHLRQGILQLTVMTPIDDDEGSLLSTRLAGSIAESFPADLDLFEDGVRVTIQKAPTVGGGLKVHADTKWAVPVSVWYQSFA